LDITCFQNRLAKQGWTIFSSSFQRGRIHFHPDKMITTAMAEPMSLYLIRTQDSFILKDAPNGGLTQSKFGQLGYHPVANYETH